jgi:hypothetical protein
MARMLVNSPCIFSIWVSFFCKRFFKCYLNIRLQQTKPYHFGGLKQPLPGNATGNGGSGSQVHCWAVPQFGLLVQVKASTLKTKEAILPSLWLGVSCPTFSGLSGMSKNHGQSSIHQKNG